MRDDRVSVIDILIERWKDRYTPEEFVEHLGINMEELVQELYPWMLDHQDIFEEELEEFMEEEYE